MELKRYSVDRTAKICQVSFMPNLARFVIYPTLVWQSDRVEAMRIARDQSRLPETGGRTRVVDCDEECVIARFSDGEEVPAHKERSQKLAGKLPFASSRVLFTSRRSSAVARFAKCPPQAFIPEQVRPVLRFHRMVYFRRRNVKSSSQTIHA